MSGLPRVDVVVLTRNEEPLDPAVEDGLRGQCGVELVVHRVVGNVQPGDDSRYETIARARNKGCTSGSAPWLMFLDDDVVLEPGCVADLVEELKRRPAFGALAADYLGEQRAERMAQHVSMGATLFRREALREIAFRWGEDRCECQCCCDDLRRQRWAIDYYASAGARHLREPDSEGDPPDYPAYGACCERRCRRRVEAPSVCLVVCYLGPLPGWIRYYLQSCAFNPTIDFLIFTDQADYPPTPPNVHIERIDAAGFERLAASKMGFPVELSHARKLCDFKPAYGHLFAEFLGQYAYWGYTDLDVIYGDLRRFLTHENLQSFDVFTARREFLVGHFTLFRNTPEIARLYQQSSDLRKTLQAPCVQSFDECGQQWWQRMDGKPLSRDASCDSMSHIVQRLAENGEISARLAPAALEWPELPDAGWRLRWRAGRLSEVRQDREAMYVHFHGFKDNPGFRQPATFRDETAFEITPDGISHVAGNSNSTKLSGVACCKRAISEREGRSSSRPMVALQRLTRDSPQPCILTTFNRRHFKPFWFRFLASLRISGNHEQLIPVGVGLSSSQRDRLSRTAAVQPVFREDCALHVARRRLIEFADITRSLSPETPVAYWDCGDVIFQSELQPLWDLVALFPGQLLAAREPCGYPDNPVVIQWTESIADSGARRDAQELVLSRPFLNSGFLAGTASALTAYFDAVSHWYDGPKLGGSTDPGDQLALNVYCHSRPEAWREVSDQWNFCLWGRESDAWRRRKGGQFVNARGAPIAVVHGNAGTLPRAPARLLRSLD